MFAWNAKNGKPKAALRNSVWALAFLSFSLPCSGMASNVTVAHLRCEHRNNPLGIDAAKPRLSWELESAERGQKQSAYQIIVASSPDLPAKNKGGQWDSGKVVSDTLEIPYAGLPLRSSTRYYWKVKIWDGDRIQSAWSQSAWFETGLLQASDWKGEWIGSRRTNSPPNKESPLPAPMLRKEFLAGRPALGARLYICGLGLYDAQLNGRHIGESVLDPAETRYDRRVLYRTYDITPLLKTGTNCIGVELGRGFYDIGGETPWEWNSAPWRSSPKLICQINLTFADGTTEVVPSDSSWKLCVHGPERSDSIYWGETYDARLEKPGWTQPGFDNSGFTNAGVVSPPAGRFDAQELPPIKIVETRHPISVSHPTPNDYVFDAGFVTAGWAKFSASCPRDARWVIRYAEKLRKNGTVYWFRLNNVGGLAMTDAYTFKGGGVESWEPKFSYKGFRYVDVIGSPVPLTTNNLEIRVVHSAVTPVGEFQCSDPLFNTLHENAVRTILNNLHGVPTDTPAFEKNGWMGDANVIAETALFNFDMTSFFEKWIDDMRDCQADNGMMPLIVPTAGWGMDHSPEWSSAFVFIPWHLYEYNGDERVLEDHYQEMKRYAAFEISRLKDGISDSCHGDWAAPAASPGEGGSLTGTAYVYRALRLEAKIARLLGRTQDAESDDEVCARIREAFNRHFFDPDSKSYHTEKPVGYRQTSNILPLMFGLAPENQRAAVLKNLVADIHSRGNHLNTGILGTKYLLPLLTENGQSDLAYAIANQTTYPSWGWWVANGATTMWEQWELDGRSRDHYFFGTVDEWFFKYLAGIRPDAENPGFRHFSIHPVPMGNLTRVKAHYDSVRGRIVSEWEKKNGEFTIHIVVPPNAGATVYLPAENNESILESGKPAAQAKGVKFLGKESGSSVFEVESGSYSFEIRPTGK